MRVARSIKNVKLGMTQYKLRQRWSRMTRIDRVVAFHADGMSHVDDSGSPDSPKAAAGALERVCSTSALVRARWRFSEQSSVSLFSLETFSL